MGWAWVRAQGCPIFFALASDAVIHSDDLTAAEERAAVAAYDDAIVVCQHDPAAARKPFRRLPNLHYKDARRRDRTVTRFGESIEQLGHTSMKSPSMASS